MTYEKTEATSSPRTTAKKPAADPAYPPKLVEFMMGHWKGGSGALPRPIPWADTYAKRRMALSAKFPGEALVIPTGHEKVRANDTYFRFRAGSDFFYLTGNQEPDCVLLMVPKPGGGHRAHLFVEPNPGRTSETFFTDRKKGELWVGPRLGVPESRARFAVDQAFPLSELKAALTEHPTARVLRGLSHEVDALFPSGAEGKVHDELATALSEQRLCKDPLELSELRKVIAATKRGFEDVIRALPTAKSERTVEGVFNTRARLEGSDVGYGTIAAAGAHACVLHWTRNDGPLNKNQLLLLDAGVEGHALYTADITRTVPIGGRFSPEQREIYQLVWRAQQAGLSGVAPGNDFMEPNRRAMQVLAEGLESLGILPMSASEALKDEHQFYKRYSLHNTSHMLGLDVHDCAKARQEVYKLGPLKPGMVLTVEPGLYFQTDDLTVPKRYRGVGIRIEDDVVVTSRGMTNLSASIPSEASAVERWIRQLWRG